MVTSDSLAAESIQEGGSFAANSDSRGPMAQPSYSTTTTTADISSATALDSAPDAEARHASEEWNEAAQMKAGRTLSQEDVSDVTNQAASAGDNSQPKGKDIQEGGFDSDAPNASFDTDIGGKNDPGRAALGRIQETNVPVAGGAGARQGEVTNDGQYDVLKDESA